MIYLGSGAEYDIRHYKPRMNEDYFDTYVPVDDYGFSKYVCSKYMTIVKNLLELPIVINQNVYFDYLYINDLVKIIEYFINYKVKNKFYNVTTGRTIDLLTIANKINQIAEKTSKIIINKRGLNTEYSGDNTKLLEELHGFNFTPFDEALEELYLWYKNNLAKIDKKIIEKDEHLKHCRTKL
jgi:GDP-L-fucose synthase